HDSPVIQVTAQSQESPVIQMTGQSGRSAVSPVTQMSGQSLDSPDIQVTGQCAEPVDNCSPQPVDNPESPDIQMSGQCGPADAIDRTFGDPPEAIDRTFRAIDRSSGCPTTKALTPTTKTTKPPMADLVTNGSVPSCAQEASKMSSRFPVDSAEAREL